MESARDLARGCDCSESEALVTISSLAPLCLSVRASLPLCTHLSASLYLRAGHMRLFVVLGTLAWAGRAQTLLYGELVALQTCCMGICLVKYVLTVSEVMRTLQTGSTG